MERKIVRHAVGAAAHEAALDAEFHQGQRVVTIDGFAGRILFVSPSFSPGVQEYQVQLDNGAGGGAYIASQLRPVPDSYRAPAGPQSHLPAGVTASIEAEAGEIHLASEDYPEMGSVLHDRPDPAGQFQVIGSRHTADAYAQGYDERDDDENGGEADTGIYWETPANQQWRDDNLGEPPEPQIEDAADVPGYGPEQFARNVMARMQQLALADQLEREATTVNGQQIDGHGDAPQHGLVSRANDPNVYDGQSTEGQGDPDQDKPLPGADEDAERGSTTGMFPSGVFAGDGFGMGFGSRVPWTGEERTELHGWDNGLAASAGDFVPSTNYTNRHPVLPHEELSEPAEEVIERSLGAQGSFGDDRLCAYVHHGDCTWPGEEPIAVHGESLRHPRPRGYFSELHVVSDEERQRHLEKHGITPTHAIHGMVNGRHLGTLTFQQSDDGRAAYVTNLHSNTQGKGLASAMMDDLYSHARQHGMWINHGQRTHQGVNWWNSYSEPHPGLNVHQAGPTEPMRESSRHPAGHPWKEYWSPHDVAGDIWVNHEKDQSGKHPEPHFDEYAHEDEPHYERWTQSIKPLPKAEDDPAWADAKADAAHDFEDDDPYHGWGDMAGEHEHQHAYASRTAAMRNPDHHYEQHLIDAHGYSEGDIERLRESAHSVHDMHGAIHAAGLAQHKHENLPQELAAGWRHHEQQQVADRFGRAPTRQYLKTMTDPAKGGAPGSYDPGEFRDAEPRLPEQKHYYSSLHEAGSIRVRQHGDNDYEFTFGKGEDQDPANSLDEGEPDERPDELDDEQESNGLENGEPDGGAGAGSETGPGTGDETTGQEPPGNLPAGVTPPARPSSPSKRPPVVPQGGAGSPESWPLATAPVQEGFLPLSEGGKPGPKTQRMKGVNPAQLQMPGAGEGAEVDGEKPGSDEGGKDKPPSKEAALAAFTAAAGSQSFRFEFTASWRDVVAKARRLRTAGRVRIVHSSRGMVIGEVGGDHDVYECGIQRPPARPQAIQHWACGCPWASFHQDSSYPGRLNGRPCSHVYALQLEASSRYSRSTDAQVYQDPSADELGVPHQVVVKSMPPWGPGGWRRTWLAPAASLARTAEMFCPACGDDRDDFGQCYGCKEVSRDLRQEDYLPGAMNISPSKIAARVLVAAGEDPADVELLATTAGIDLMAAANDPWGDNNYAEHPPPKPYGATEPPRRDVDPGSYGPLSGPDPEDWGEIPETGLIGPMTSESSLSAEGVLPNLDLPSGPPAADTPDMATPYPARTNTAGPATALDPADPQGIRMEEAIRDPEQEGASFERHMIEMHGQPPGNVSRWDHEHHARDHEHAVRAREIGEPPETHWEGWHSHPYEELPWEQRRTSGRWPDAGGGHSFTASDERALDDPTPWAGQHHHPECTCPTCEYDRYHAKHAVHLAVQAGMAELEAAGEAQRQGMGVDGTMGDAQDVPHEFHGNTPYCPACGLAPDAPIHHRDSGAQAELHDRPEPALPEATAGLEMPDIQVAGGDPLAAATTGGGPGMSMHDEDLSPSDTSIQTVGAENFGGDDGLADESFSVSPQENGAEAYADDPVSQFQATAGARQYAGGGGAPAGDGDIAQAARSYLAKTADVLPDHEAAALIAEGRGSRARNLDMLQLEGTHYEDVNEEMAHRGLSLDDYDDDLVVL